ncbi:MAG: iron-containing alcohol dehydrogenase [Oscillospiraceae bacterium]|nr:iron-containing alcohol dehydrogenase [Oscillospiraceae bacterium]
MKEVKDILGRPFACACGRTHEVPIEEIGIDLAKIDLPKRLEALFGGKKILVVCDAHTKGQINDRLCASLESAGFEITRQEYDTGGVLFNTEAVVGAAVIANAPKLDGILCIGSGTITDLGRYVGSRTHKPFVHVMTAPSMDGYASDVAGLVVGGQKKIYKDCEFPKAVYGDLDVLCAAPADMIKSGFGDMLGKRTALADWVLSRELTGEYFCAYTAALIEQASKACIDCLDGIVARERTAIGTLTNALCDAGVAMALAQDTRPASGSEHIFSHYLVEAAIDEKRAYIPSHGETVGFGSLVSALLYEYLLAAAPRDIAGFRGEMAAYLYAPGDVARMLDVSGIGSRVGGFLPSKDALAAMIRSCASPKKRYTIIRYLNDRGLLDDAVAYVAKNMQQ